MKILSIDPGNVESAYAVLDGSLRPVRFGKIKNEQLLEMIYNHEFDDCNLCAIEKIASYGMAVGASIFDTCIWIGRFQESILRMLDIEAKMIFRKEEKLNLCGSMKAKDGNIRQALIDRFGEVGTIKNKGWFYGVSKDVWAAIAVGCTYYDVYIKDIERW